MTLEIILRQWMNEHQVDKFIKKMTKMYKALRVLEKNKDKESTCFSKSIEKLIRYFSKKFPEDFGIEKSLNDFALQNF